MNGSAACHEIEGVPGLFVDAFRGQYLRKTSDASNAFVLSHYHGDHYGSLPRDGKYNGPALIHCTPVTAALLRHVHKVPSQFVVEHNYGVAWTFEMPRKVADNDTSKEKVSITFYDANHCPGAAIIAIQLSDGTVHLHTGDMRYHPKMKSYPVLQEAVRNRKLDLLYLDTTYGHPKHTFVPQEKAIESIASQIHELLSSHGQCGASPRQQKRDDPSKPKILILLSCYSIGKERVLWEACRRVNQPVYVTERKFDMMTCIKTPENPTCDSKNDNLQPCNNMIQRCTRDQNATDLHVIKMGLAGELWPFFKPNYRNCVDYEEELQENYDKVVAFIPTGWAEGSNWNKKNAVSRRQLECRKSKRFVDVEIRLIAYSEHSSCSELVSFVEYCRPRKVIPTVFGDANDRRRLEKLFRKYVDTSRAKLQFFKGMQAASPPKLKDDAPNYKVDPKAEAKQDVKNGMSSIMAVESNDKEETQKEVKDASLPENRCGSVGECFDLTCLPSDEEPDSPGPQKQSSQPDCDWSKKDIELAVKRSLISHSSETKKMSPTKRKRNKTSEKQSTPPITKFFAAKRSR